MIGYLRARGLWSFVILLLGASAFAHETPADFRPISEFHHTTWTADEGSPGDTWSAAQTPDGWLWLGGPRGLFRFDGVQFESVAIEGLRPGQATAVHSLFAAETGELWVGHVRGGITRIQGDSMRHFGEAEGLPVASVFSMARDEQGVMWAATSGALLRLEGDRWRSVGAESGFTDENPTNVRFDAHGTLWIGGRSHMFRLRPAEQRIERTSVQLNGGADFTMAPDGRLWYIDYAGVHLLPDQPAGLRAPPRANSFRTSHVLFDSEGHVWTTLKGFQRHPVPSGARSILFESSAASRFGEKEGLSGDRVHTVLEDQEGNVWVVTRGGIDRFRPTNVHKLYLAGERSPNSALAAADDGMVWIGVHHGGFSRGPLEGLWRSDGRNAEHVLPKVIPPITAAHRDSSGAVWIGGWEGLWRRDRNGEFAKVSDLPQTAQHQIHAITVDDAGDPWLSIVQSALHRLRRGTWEQNGNLAALPADRPTVHARDDKGRLWFGYRDNRVAVVESERVRLYGAQDGLQVGTITAIHVGRFTLVAGERAFAVLSNDRFHRLQAPDDPAALEGVSGIVEAHGGDLWLNGFRGAVRIAARELDDAIRSGRHAVPVEVFDSQDGFPGQAQNIRGVPTLIKGTDDRLWFAGTLGIGWLDPRDLRRNQLVPPVQVRSAISGDHAYPVANIMNLPKGTRDLQINYTALSLSRPEKVRFRYRLLGSHDHWIDAGSRRQAFYTNLAPGEYQFQVIAANESGVWNEQGVTQQISIPPLFTQTKSFLALCALAALALMSGAYALRIKQVTARERSRLEERLRERERIARELHDTLLQGVQGLVLRLQAAVDGIELSGEARRAIVDQLDRAEALLTHGRDRVQALRDASTAPFGLKQALIDAAAHMTRAHAARIRFTEQGTSRELHPIVREEAAAIAIEAMRNAVRHAAAETIDVELRYERRQLGISVRDNGRGMDEAVVRSGRDRHFGILGMHERAKRIRGRIHISSHAGKGTEVILSVPASMAYVRATWTQRIREILD